MANLLDTDLATALSEAEALVTQIETCQTDATAIETAYAQTIATLVAAGYAVDWTGSAGTGTGDISPSLPSAGSGTPATLILTWPATSIAIGATVTPTVTVKNAAGATLTGTWVINYTSSNTSYATVGATSGTVTGVNVGTPTITGSVNGYSSVTASQPITVTVGTPASLTLTYTSTTVSVGGATQTPTIVIKDSKSNVLTGYTTNFTSSNTSYATVGSTSGTVTAVAPGSPNIVGTVAGYSGATATVPFTVQAGTPASLTLTYATTSLTVGGTTVTPTITVKDAGGNTLSNGTYPSTFTSSATGTLTVGNSTGTVSPVAAGSANVVGTVNGYSAVTSTIGFSVTNSSSSSKLLVGAHAQGLRGSYATDLTCAKLVKAPILRCIVPWYDTEPSSGSYSWTTLDALVAAWGGAGIKIILTDWASPSWANGNSDGAFVPNYTTANAAYTTWYNARMTYLSALFTRYKGKIWGYEYWNEPNQGTTVTSGTGGQWDSTPDVPGYAAYVVGAHALHSSIDPHSGGGSYDFMGCITGINAGPSYSYGSSGLQFLQAVYTAGAEADGVSCHPYCGNQAPTTTTANQNNFSDIGLVRTLMNNNGQSAAGIILTEFGWSISSVAAGTQPSYLTQAYGLLQSTYTYVPAACYFQLENTAAYPNNNLCTTANAITPVGTAFQAVAAGLGYTV